MRPKDSSVSIIVPTYNEKEHIANLIEALYANIAAPLEVIVVDDASPDGTADIVAALQFPGLRVIRRKARGLAGAFHRGILEARGDILGWMDADMTMPANVMNQLIEQLDEHHIAIGSRYVEGGSDNRHPLRTLASRAINALAREMLKNAVRDYDSGFIAIRREVFDYVTLIPFGYGEYFIEFIYDAHRAGLRIKEVGYLFKDRSLGVSKSAPSLISFFVTGLRYVLRIFNIRMRFITGRD
ncbi:MAG TPA: glycosyltransferase [Anaerolineales bacterium]|nr:glycosyltransferase [Anaerolineales bacterium]HRQ91589.1 glycosyltransferase [Anaerolineales bacterium]